LFGLVADFVWLGKMISKSNYENFNKQIRNFHKTHHCNADKHAQYSANIAQKVHQVSAREFDNLSVLHALNVNFNLGKARLEHVICYITRLK
jgi:hypothetical protein